MIPTEIVDHILNVLRSEEDYTTLETCSVIYPQIVDRHLYSQITFYTPSDSKHLTNLIDDRGTYVVDPTHFSLMLLDRPHVANYVRVVRILVGLGSAGRESKLILPLIPSILSKLSRIESIVLSAVCLASWYLSWSTLDPEFCTAFQNSVRLPSIREVIISNINGFSLTTFDNCENLRRLQLYAECTDGEGVSTSPYPRLSSLGVGKQPDLTKMVSWAKTNTLQTLSFLIHFREEFQQFRTLIEACSATLVKLELNHVMSIDISNLTIPVFPDLRLPILEHIVFRSPILVEGVRRHHSFLPLVVPFLTSIKRVSSPIHLTLHLQLHLFLGVAIADIDWSALVSIFVLPIFSHPIELYINPVRALGAEFLDVVSSFEQNADLKRLLSDGKLVIIHGDELTCIHA